ncbi:SDR family NAD(P)-dependent oxidoreductase [Polymorphobacter fuscus]|uniref:SDR family oxidoreductase n=1 Tax=Sandarakinorhabdus fusca TaxID=1439888 RepID=A0A7C9KGU4_9SPHN|nr:SDR family oxidoreductase [Polymorphobacter fuscus]KAB7648441.1 SDR family oxidoreductase [Polymorphobacter fuscus]MQT15961.1 SDR family oxidoreductase [Polymorphobacter fuscus]NJC07762.1 NAD(P)-dependent dehydrogenase (short-subunit alcohol dehydrogenase family) [Polymorphobacter fuscus]
MVNILLTGASRGIGAAARIALHDAGHMVIGQSTAGDDGLIAADFAHPGAADALWDAALAAAGGRIDVLINNAGVFEAVDIADAEGFAATWGRSHAINLQSAADLCRHAVLHFQRFGGGRIINVASRAGHRGDSPSHWHYAAAKGGMLALTKTIARGYAAQEILAFAVAPGFTLTGMAEEYLATRGGDKLLADIPLGRVADAAEVAEAIRWLALDAPPSLTGSTLDINGASYVR